MYGIGSMTKQCYLFSHMLAHVRTTQNMFIGLYLVVAVFWEVSVRYDKQSQKKAVLHLEQPILRLFHSMC